MHKSHDPTFPLYPVLSFIGFIVTLVPLPWHIQAWNSGTCAFMVWTACTCLIGFINSIIWAGNVENVAPVWCDISSKLILGASIGIPASTLCISRRLYSLTSIQTVSVTRDDKRRMVIIDLCIAAGLPLLIMILHVIVQGHRFDLVEDIGCYPVVYNTLPAYFLYFMWPTALGVVSFCYSSLTLRSFWIRRAQFNQVLASNNSLNMSRYVRLMMLAIVDMMFTIPQSIFITYIGNKGVRMAPWISWEDTHFDFGRIALYPALIWRNDPSFALSVELTRFLPVVCAFLFFALFGFANESMKHYRLAFWAIAGLFGFKQSPHKPFKLSLPNWTRTLKANNSTPSVGSLPVYVPNLPSQKKNRRGSLSYVSGVELSIYSETDAEKSVGLSSPSTGSTIAPPEYTRPEPHHVPLDVTATAGSDFGTPSSPTAISFGVELEPEQQRPTAKASQATLRSLASMDRIYVSAEVSRTCTPSPPPFTNMSTLPYHRPFASPSDYPAAQPHPGTLARQASRFTEAV